MTESCKEFRRSSTIDNAKSGNRLDEEVAMVTIMMLKGRKEAQGGSFGPENRRLRRFRTLPCDVSGLNMSTEAY